MGIISGYKAIRALRSLKKDPNKKVKLSLAQIADLLVNLPNAYKKLPKEQVEKVQALYDEFQKSKFGFELDYDGYIETAAKIIKRFDAIAPYQKYSGQGEAETEFLLDEIYEYLGTNEEKIEEITHLAKAKEVYGRLNEIAVSAIYTYGENQIANTISSIAWILDVDLAQAGVERYYYLLSLHTELYIQYALAEMSKQHSSIKFLSEHPEIENGSQKFNQLYAYCKATVQDPLLLVTSKDKMLEVLVDAYLDEKERKEQETVSVTEQQKYVDDADYGLVPNKPIYTQGVSGSKEYLEKLLSKTGETLRWERQGSLHVEGINGMIDVYFSFLPSGKQYRTVYVNMYGSLNSTQIPDGFSSAER